MTHQASEADELFRSRFEACELPMPFTHRDHVRLAYVELTQHDLESAHSRIRRALLRYLRHQGIEPSTKYHETLTRAWLLAVRHFMEISETSDSAEAFLEQKPRLLQSSIMLKHYSEGRLFSPEARARFLEPDLLPIPSYGD